MSEKVYEVPEFWRKRGLVDQAKYEAMYAASVKDPDAFWGEHGKRLDWIKPYTKAGHHEILNEQCIGESQ